MESVYNLGGGGAEAPGGAPPRRGVKAVPQAGGVPMHRNSSQVRPPSPPPPLALSGVREWPRSAGA